MRQVVFAVAGLICSVTASIGQPSGGLQMNVTIVHAPVFKNKSENPVIGIRVYVPEGKKVIARQIAIRFDPESVKRIEKVNVFKGEVSGFDVADESNLLASVEPSADGIPLNLDCFPGLTHFGISIVVRSNANINQKIAGKVIGLITSSGELNPSLGSQEFSFRIGTAVRLRQDDGVHTFRIPGIVSTNRGTLIGVYDVRYKNSRDLPGHDDVGMSRSSDGGNTWEPMKVIMDMGSPHENNGIGDPSILFDPVTNRIWVAALWSKGNRSIAGSEPGLSPDSTGQFVLSSSADDGQTWSSPSSITSQVKDPKWHLYFQGPGTGIAMTNGTLVFPSQYWDETKKPGVPHSSIIYSVDHGKTWKSGVGARSNTTESQVVETKPGTLMLSMRDNRGRLRSISTTKDMGSTWLDHPTSRLVLQDPVCMASLIKTNVAQGGKITEVLFFCNPSTSDSRSNLTIRASFDLGESWENKNHLLIDERRSYGYSSLTRIDDQTIGLLYEGVGDLFFVRIPVAETIK